MIDEAVQVTKKVRLNNARAELQLTQQQLADRASLNRMVVMNAEKGKPITRLSAFAILKVLNGIRQDLDLPILTIDDLDWKIRGDA